MCNALADWFNKRCSILFDQSLWSSQSSNLISHTCNHIILVHYHWLPASLITQPAGGNVLPIFEFFIQFSIGLCWSLQIRLFKFWKLVIMVILCIKIWKLQIRRGSALHPTWNNGIFKFRLEDYILLRLMKTPCFSHWITVPKNHGKCELARFIGSEKAIPKKGCVRLNAAKQNVTPPVWA